MKSMYEKHKWHLCIHGYTVLYVDWICKDIIEELRTDLFAELVIRQSKEVQNKLVEWLMWSFVPLFKHLYYESYKTLEVISVNTQITEINHRGDFNKTYRSEKVHKDDFVIICNLNSSEIIFNVPYGNMVLKPGHLLIAERRILQYAFHLNEATEPTMIFCVHIRIRKRSFLPTLCCFPRLDVLHPAGRRWTILLPNNEYYKGDLHM